MGIGIESNRWEALARVLLGAALSLSLILPIIALIGAVAGSLWMTIDILVQLITGREGWKRGTSGVAGLLERLYYWPLDITQRILFGDRDLPVMP